MKHDRQNSRAGRGWERMLVAALMAGLAWFYWWTVTGVGGPADSGQRQNDYYNLLTEGFLDGYLYLKAEVSPELAAAENPYDPAKRPPNAKGMHDVSYFKGHFYLYFGVTPVVTLFLPYRLLAGTGLPAIEAMWVFALGGLLASAATWLGVRRRYYPESGPIVALLGILALGVVSLVPALLRRPSFWEMPIACGYGCAMLALWCVYRGLHAVWPGRWLACAAVSLGLAVGARPGYVFGCVMLVVPLLWSWRSSRRKGRRRWWTEAGGVAGSLAVIGGVLALYNYRRFGSPFEFGLNYQLTANHEMMMEHFRLRFAPLNTWLYFFAPAEWGRYFPFVHLINSPVTVPAGYYSWEYVWGAGTNMPVVWLALAALLAGWGRANEEGGRLTALALTVWTFFAAMAGALACFNTAALRYMADFMPSLVLAACLGLLVVERWLRGTTKAALRRWGRVAWGAALLYSTFFALMVSMQIHDVLQANNPERYRRVARFFNFAPHWMERAFGIQHGPLEIKLRFPLGRTGDHEPIVTTGWGFFSDRLQVNYPDNRHVQFVFDHASRGSLASKLIPVDYFAAHDLRIEMGSLYPPAAHPYHDGKTELETISRTRWLRVLLDSGLVFEGAQAFYDATPGSVWVGRDPAARDRAKGYGFTGQILQVKRSHYQGLVEPRNAYGSVRMKVAFPRGLSERRQPLVSTGAPKAGDMFYAHYLDDTHVQFGLDHWGGGAAESQPIEIEYGRLYALDVRMGSLYPSGRSPQKQALLDRIIVKLDGRYAWSLISPLHPSSPLQVMLGRNGIGAGACDPAFQGIVTEAERVMEDLEKFLQPAEAVRMEVYFKGNTGQTEPLLVTGRTGRADILVVRYLDDRTVQFGHDHWGYSLHWSEPVRADFAQPHILEMSLGSMHGATKDDPRVRPWRDRVLVRLDGQTVWERKAQFHDAAPGEVFFGRNAVGGSSCVEYFSGAILSIDSAALPAENRSARDAPP